MEPGEKSFSTLSHGVWEGEGSLSGGRAGSDAFSATCAKNVARTREALSW